MELLVIYFFAGFFFVPAMSRGEVSRPLSWVLFPFHHIVIEIAKA